MTEATTIPLAFTNPSVYGPIPAFWDPTTASGFATTGADGVGLGVGVVAGTLGVGAGVGVGMEWEEEVGDAPAPQSGQQ